jgi:tetratricopeptide (TPR) repeat protein
MRFRATEEVNAILANAARQRGHPLIDIHAAFVSRSAGGIPGGDLICDHLHPNPDGYYLMARVYYAAIDTMGMLRGRETSFTPAEIPEYITDLDWDIGLLKVYDMMRRWPFREETATGQVYRAHGDTAAAKVAAEYLHVNNVWSRAHDAMAKMYEGRGDFDRARHEYEAIAVFSPDDPWPYQQIAHTYEIEENWPARSEALRMALRRAPAKGLIGYQLALSEWRQNHLEEAIRLMDLAASAPELSRPERQNALFFLAGFLSDEGRSGEARKVLRLILTDDPTFVPALRFLRKLEGTGK